MKKKILSFLFVALLSLGLTASPAAAEQTLDTIAVDGEVSQEMAPDMATLYLNITNQEDTVEEARNATAGTTGKITRALLAQGVTSADIKTTNYNMSPVYLRDKQGKSKLKGYRVSTSLQVTVNNLAQAGTIIDSCLASGASRLDGINFGLQNRKLIERQLLAAAVENARAKAAIVAQAGGRALGTLRYASLGRVAGMTYRANAPAKLAATADSEHSAPTEINPGSLNVSVHANTVFGLN